MIIATVNEILGADGDVSAFVVDRIYPEELPEAPTYPALVVTKVGGQGQYDMNGDAGLEFARVQVDVYARGYAEMEAIRTAVRRLLSGYRTPAGSGDPCQIQATFCINDFDLPVATVLRSGPRLRRRCLEFNIWNTEV